MRDFQGYCLQYSPATLLPKEIEHFTQLLKESLKDAKDEKIAHNSVDNQGHKYACCLYGSDRTWHVSVVHPTTDFFIIFPRALFPFSFRSQDEMKNVASGTQGEVFVKIRGKHVVGWVAFKSRVLPNFIIFFCFFFAVLNMHVLLGEAIACHITKVCFHRRIRGRSEPQRQMWIRAKLRIYPSGWRRQPKAIR